MSDQEWMMGVNEQLAAHKQAIDDLQQAVQNLENRPQPGPQPDPHHHPPDRREGN